VDDDEINRIADKSETLAWGGRGTKKG